MSRKEWNKLKDKIRYHTEEDIRIDEERRKKVWDDAEKRRREIESGTYVKPKRKYTRRNKK
jgi:replicative DNA helicase